MCAISVDQDEMAHYEPSHQDPHCCHYAFDFTLKPLFEAVDMSKFKDGRVHFRNSGMKGLKLKKLLSEMSL